MPTAMAKKDPKDIFDRIVVPMPKDLVLEVEEYRFETRCESRAEAARKLMEIGLKYHRKSSGK